VSLEIVRSPTPAGARCERWFCVRLLNWRAWPLSQSAAAMGLALLVPARRERRPPGRFLRSR